MSTLIPVLNAPDLAPYVGHVVLITTPTDDDGKSIRNISRLLGASDIVQDSIVTGVILVVEGAPAQHAHVRVIPDERSARQTTIELVR